jgi:hypothetical protein
MNVRPAVFFLRGIDRQIVLFRAADRSRDVHFDFRDWQRACRKRMVTDRAVQSRHPCCPGFFPVSGLPDTRIGATNEFLNPHFPSTAAGRCSIAARAIRSWVFGG